MRPPTQFNRETHARLDRRRTSRVQSGCNFCNIESVISALQNGEIPEKYFDLVIVDECHHAPSQSFSSLLNDLDPDFLLGVTATPWRSDDGSLLDLFGEPCFL